MTQWYQALIIRAIRRVLKKLYGIEINLAESYETIKNQYKQDMDKIIADMLQKEIYLKKTVIPIPISLVVIPEEPEENPEEQAQAEAEQAKGGKGKFEPKTEKKNKE